MLTKNFKYKKLFEILEWRLKFNEQIRLLKKDRAMFENKMLHHASS